MSNTLFTPSRYQQDFFDALADEDGDLQLVAVAGSGKTKSIEEGVKRLPPSFWRSVLCTAFNNHIKTELVDRQKSGKIPQGVTIQTIHGLGYGILRNHFQPRDTRNWVDGRKYVKLTRIAWENCEGARNLQSRKDYNNAVDATAEIVRLSMLTLTDSDDPDALARMADTYSVELPGEDFLPFIYGLTPQIIHWGQNGLPTPDRDGLTYHPGERIAFDDMVYLPVALDLSVPEYRLCLIDECQDFNRCQQELLYKARGAWGRAVWVGDPRQCQPPDTVVTLTGGMQVPISELSCGVQLASYDRESGCVVGRSTQGRKVMGVSKRPYNGRMLVVTAGGKQTRCTPNHRWITRFTEREPDVCATYLMKSGTRYRVGWCQLFAKKDGTLHLAQRARIERADAAWILGVHYDRTKASAEESIISTVFGLPTTPFHPVNGATHLTQEAIDFIFNALRCEVDLPARAEKCLHSFGRLMEFPFYTKTKQQRQGRTTLFETQACNLIPSLMSLPVYTEEKTPEWHPLSVISQHYTGDVYSLKVETHETYIADGLITHNSIYAFTGADPASFDRIQEVTGATRLPLSICYRCAKSVVAVAKRLVPTIEASDTAPEGVVVPVTPDQLMGIAEQHYRSRPGEVMLILCRTNAPLIGSAFSLIRRGVRATVKGRDIGQSLVRTLEDIARMMSPTSFLERLGVYRALQVAALEHRKASDMAIANLHDRLESLAAVFDGLCVLRGYTVSEGELQSYVLSLFSDEQQGGVVFSSIHKSKGLEARRVGILHADLLPHPKASSAIDAQGERNLAYVAVTRAREELYVAGESCLIGSL